MDTALKAAEYAVALNADYMLCYRLLEEGKIR